MASLVFAVIGAALFVGAIVLYSTPAQVPTPSYATIYLDSAFPIDGITYTVQPISTTISKVTIEVDLYHAAPPRGAPAALLQLLLPRGIAFQPCRVSQCIHASGSEAWSQHLKFHPVQGYGTATRVLYVKAPNFGENFNGVTASAATPQVFLHNGSREPTLVTRYMMASADGYDWADFPPQFSNGNMAVWDENINGGVLDGRAAVGVNHGNQAKDETKTFFAGALLGLAGAALLSAVQEALHAKD